MLRLSGLMLAFEALKSCRDFGIGQNIYIGLMLESRAIGYIPKSVLDGIIRCYIDAMI